MRVTSLHPGLGHGSCSMAQPSSIFCPISRVARSFSPFGCCWTLTLSAIELVELDKVERADTIDRVDLEDTIDMGRWNSSASRNSSWLSISRSSSSSSSSSSSMLLSLGSPLACTEVAPSPSNSEGDGLRALSFVPSSSFDLIWVPSAVSSSDSVVASPLTKFCAD